MNLVRSFTAAAFGLLTGVAAVHASTPDRVRISGGVVEGLGPQPSGVREFRGIPFAEPPVGPLRWRPPQPPRPWAGVRQATAFGARCMQLPVFSDMVFRASGMSEDCLYLNVWTPAKSGRERAPVLVYFYGGGYVAGDGSELRYDGESMARRGVVVVTMSYRLGVLGFMAHPELTAESPRRASGNYGLLDQVAALQWVRRNIGAFGGDRGRVTIAGESAGSVSVSALMASPVAKGLFAGAIGESGSLLGTLAPVPLAEAQARGSAFAKAAGASNLAAMRAMPAQALLELSGKADAIEAAPVVDGWFLPKPAELIFAAGEQAHVPLLAGANSAEAPAQAVLGDAPPTVAAYRAALNKLLGDRADAVFAAYPASGDGQPVLNAAGALASDNFIGFSTWRWMDLSTRTGGRSTFYYRFAQPRPVTRAALAADPALAGKPRAWGAVHSGEIEYVLGNLDLNRVYVWAPADYGASELAETYFANFIKTGDPNGPGLPAWPAYATGQRMTLDSAPRAESDTARSRMQGWVSALARGKK